MNEEEAQVSAESAEDATESAAPMAELVLSSVDGEGDERFALEGEATVGRYDADMGPVEVDLGANEEGSFVSRRHARIFCEDGEWKVEDLDSSNGTFIIEAGSPTKIEEPTILRDGAVLRFGKVDLRFVLDAADEADASAASDEQDAASIEEDSEEGADEQPAPEE